MSVEKVEALVVGAGQAGVAMSEHLSRNGIPHLVLERDRIAERWRTGRWDSLVANGPAWHDRFPGMEFAGDPDAFAPKEAVADYFAAYAEKIAAPIRCGVEVTRVDAQRRPARLPRRDLGGRDRGAVRRRRHRPLPAPGLPEDRPRETRASRRCIPPTTATPASCRQGRCSSSAPAPRARRSPRSCCGPAGASTSRSARTTARRAATAAATTSGGSASSTSGTRRPTPTTEHVTFAVSGAYGGETVDFRRLAARGMTLLGRAGSFADGVMSFEPGLAANLATGDANYLSVLDEADA